MLGPGQETESSQCCSLDLEHFGVSTLPKNCTEMEKQQTAKEGPQGEQASTDLSLCPQRTTSPESCGNARRGKFVPQLGYILLQITSLIQDLSPPEC